MRKLLLIFLVAFTASLTLVGQNNLSNRQTNRSSQTKTWREELGYGMFAINIENPNGIRQRTIYRACISCRGCMQCGNCYGMKVCPLCNGQGYIITAGYGNYLPCAMCQQTGKCGICKGTGKCACTNYDYPGYMPGSTTAIGPDGQIIYSDSNSGSSSSGSSSRSSSGSSSSNTCPKCGGRKFESTSYRYAAASTYGWAQPYHNYTGTECPYCGYATEHYHNPCTECRGYGHIRR